MGAVEPGQGDSGVLLWAPPAAAQAPSCPCLHGWGGAEALLVLPHSGLVWREGTAAGGLPCTPRDARMGAATGQQRGVQQRVSGALFHAPPPKQPGTSPAAIVAASVHAKCPCRTWVPPACARDPPRGVAGSGHGTVPRAMGSSWRRAQRGWRGCVWGSPSPRSCSTAVSFLLQSYAAPAGVPATARSGAAAVTLTCCPPAGDSPSPPSAPGSPAASPPSCGPRTSTCPAARPAPGDTAWGGSCRCGRSWGWG